MPAQITRILLCFALCLMLFSSWSCPSNSCLDHQDVALVESLYLDIDKYIDNVVMIVNDSITGCGGYGRRAVGTKTHHVRFPINVRVQLFVQGDLWKELFYEMDKNTEVKIYTGIDCSRSVGTPIFLRDVNLSKKDNRFIDSALTDDYCWLLKKMNNTYFNENLRCTEWAVGGKQDDICNKSFQ